MKKFVFVCSAVLLLVSCTSSPKSEITPDWFLTGGIVNKTVYPDSVYLAQLGRGKSLEVAQAEAVAALSRYISSNVSATISQNSVSEELRENGSTSVVESIVSTRAASLSSNTTLYGLEFSQPYYAKKEYFIVAYIERQEAWDKLLPEINDKRNAAMALYEDARRTENSDFLKAYQTFSRAQEAEEEFWAALFYGRLFLPEGGKEFDEDRRKLSQIARDKNVLLQKSTLFYDVRNDSGNTISLAVVNSFKELGFPSADNRTTAAYIVNVNVAENLSTSGAAEAPVYTMYPAVSVSVGNSSGAIFRTEYKVTERTAGYGLERVRRNALEKLSGIVSGALVQDFVNTLGN